MPEPIADVALVDLANALAGLRRELVGVPISTTVDVDPEQPFGPWQAVVAAVRAGATSLDVGSIGTLLERSVPAAEPLGIALAAATAIAADLGREAAIEACVVAAIDDGATVAAALGQDDPGLVFAIESAIASVLAAAYATWAVRDLFDEQAAAAGIALLDVTLRPIAALRTLRGASAAAAVLDVSATLPAETWEALAAAAVERPAEEAMASVRLRALAAVAGLGAAEATAVALLAPPDVAPDVALAGALLVGDAAVAAASTVAGATDGTVRSLASRAWDQTSR